MRTDNSLGSSSSKDSKNTWPRKLESIKAAAMVASAFFAITRFLENFDEPFHNSRSHTRSLSGGRSVVALPVVLTSSWMVGWLEESLKKECAA